MNISRRIRIIERDQVVAGIADIRAQWEDATGCDLVAAKGSVGLILGDVVKAIGLLPEDQTRALGEKLFATLSQ
jgi:hypothetical protein